MIDRDVRNPTVMVGGLFPAYDPILEEIDLRGVTVAVQGYIMNPLIPMPLSLFIYHFPLICCAHGPQFLDPLEENLVVRVLGRQDKGHAVAFKDIDERLPGVETVGGDDDGQVRMGVADRGDDPFSRIDLAVLPLSAIAPLDRFRE